MRRLTMLLVGFLALVILPVEVAAQVAQQANPVSNLFAYAGALATSAILGATKGLDFRLTASPLFRKLQPVITLAGAFAAPYIAREIGVTVDPSAFAAAPIATVVGVTAAELLSLVFHRKPGR